MAMSETHRQARIEQWAKKTKEEKSAIMSKVAKAKNAKMTREERVRHSKMMNEKKKLIKYYGRI